MRSSAPEHDRAAQRREATPETWLSLGTTYAVIVSGALLLAGAEQTLVYALTAAVFCAGHALVTGPGGKPCLSRPAGQFLAICALAFGLTQSQFSTVHLSFGLAHFLMLVQLVKLYGAHNVRDLRLIQVATIFEAMVAGLWALDLAYLPVFVLVGLALMANFSVLTVQASAALPRNKLSCVIRSMIPICTSKDDFSVSIAPISFSPVLLSRPPEEESLSRDAL